MKNLRLYHDIRAECNRSEKPTKFCAQMVFFALLPESPELREHEWGQCNRRLRKPTEMLPVL
jgi:hypothetical protein